MSVSEEYLQKLRRSVRRAPDAETDAEILDLIEECRFDIRSLGIAEEKAADETDSLILGAVRCYVRWKFGLATPDAALNREDYMQLRDELRRRRPYCISPTESS